MGFFDGIFHRLFSEKNTAGTMLPISSISAGASQTPSSAARDNWLEGLLQPKPRPQNAPYAP